MYYTGIDPLTMKKVHVTTDYHEKQLQRALLQFNRPQNAPLVREALRQAGREDLIGNGPNALVRPEWGNSAQKPSHGMQKTRNGVGKSQQGSPDGRRGKQTPKNGAPAQRNSKNTPKRGEKSPKTPSRQPQKSGGRSGRRK